MHKVSQRRHQVSQRKRIILTEKELLIKIIGCAIEVRKQLGPGLLESACQECLYYELKLLIR